MLSLPSLT